MITKRDVVFYLPYRQCPFFAIGDPTKKLILYVWVFQDELNDKKNNTLVFLDE